MATVSVNVDGRDYSLDIPPDWLDLDEVELQARLGAEVRASRAQHKTGEAAEFVDNLFENSGLPMSGRWYRALEIAREARERGAALFTEGVEAGETGRAPVEALWKTLAGGLSYVMSPAEGLFRGYMGEPAGDLSAAALDAYSRLAHGEDALTTEELKERGRYTPSQAIEEFFTYGPMSVSPSTWGAKVAQIAPAGTQFYGPMRYLTGQPKPLPAATAAPDLPPGAAAAEKVPHVVDEAPIPVDTTTRGAVERLSVGAVEDIVTEPGIISKVARARAEAGGDKERFFRTVGRYLQEGLENGEITAGSLPRIVDDLGLDPAEMANFFRVSVSESGRTLNLLSQAVRRMAKDSTYPPALRAELDSIAGRMELGRKVDPDYWMQVWGKAENFRRGMLVGQVATTMRNISTQAGRLTIGMIDDALQGALRGTNATESLTGVWNSISANMGALPVIRKMNGGQKLVDDILAGQPITKERLLNRTIHEVSTINRFVNGVNKFNTLQERFFRRLAFQARLTKLMKDAKMPQDGPIPAEFIEDSVEHALQMTFASSGGTLSKKLIKMFENFPPLYMINPFPRFSYANALPFVSQFSPWGLMKSFSPRTVAQLASGNPREFVETASRGLIGTALMAKAIEMRNGPNAGEKWYEYKWGDKTINTLPFAPLSTYLFLAEAMKPDNNIKAIDWTTAAIGLNRISGTGLVLIDALRDKNIDGTKKKIQRFVAQYAGSYTVPLRTIKDFYEGITGDQTYADPRADDFWSELVNTTYSNMPYLSKFVAQRATPLKVEQKLEPMEFFGFEMPGPIARQFTGIAGIKKSDVETEVHRLNLSPATYMPRGANRDADRWTAMTMAPTVSMIVPAVMEADVPVFKIMPNLKLIGAFDPEKSYKELDDTAKQMVLTEIFRLVRKMAEAEMKLRKPTMYARTKLPGMLSQLEAEYLEQNAGIDLRSQEQLKVLFP